MTNAAFNIVTATYTIAISILLLAHPATNTFSGFDHADAFFWSITDSNALYSARITVGTTNAGNFRLELNNSLSNTGSWSGTGFIFVGPTNDFRIMGLPDGSGGAWFLRVVQK